MLLDLMRSYRALIEPFEDGFSSSLSE
ncbi:hypothetical protein D049_2162A, partial [Vibrio parahaemolyticus VPTS-2010]